MQPRRRGELRFSYENLGIQHFEGEMAKSRWAGFCLESVPTGLIIKQLSLQDFYSQEMNSRRKLSALCLDRFYACIQYLYVFCIVYIIFIPISLKMRFLKDSARNLKSNNLKVGQNFSILKRKPLFHLHCNLKPGSRKKILRSW